MSLADLTSPTAVKQAIAECDRLGRDKFLADYGFGHAREYLLRYNGKEYDSKAIAGVAHKYQFPEIGALGPHDFSGGISEGAAARKLAELGFEIIGMSAPNGWTLSECEVAVRAYFGLVRDQYAGTPMNKAATYKKVATQLNGRSAKSVEYKFQNVEKILEEEGLPRLGMSTKSNYQTLLRAVVLDYVRQNPDILGHVPAVAASSANVTKKVFVTPPTGAHSPSPATGEKKDTISSMTLDIAESDAHNKRLGAAGEEWVVAVEKQRLLDAGRGDLAAKVVWVAKDIGDGAGYDVASFAEDGSELFIEVKTTNCGPSTRFFITQNELRTSANKGKAFRLTEFSAFRVSRGYSSCRGRLKTNCT